MGLSWIREKECSMLRRILTVALALGIGLTITNSLSGCKSDEEKAKDEVKDTGDDMKKAEDATD